MTFTFINQLKLINVSEFADKKTKQLNEDDTKQHSEHWTVWMKWEKKSLHSTKQLEAIYQQQQHSSGHSVKHVNCILPLKTCENEWELINEPRQHNGIYTMLQSAK